MVVSDGLAARQWQVHLAAESLAAGQRAWPSPRVESYRAWSQALWDRAPSELSLLNAHQANALWRRIVNGSAAGRELLAVQGAAGWAARAWRDRFLASFEGWEEPPDRDRRAASAREAQTTGAPERHTGAVRPERTGSRTAPGRGRRR